MKIKNLHDAVIAVANSLNGNITNNLDDIKGMINSVEVTLPAVDHIAIMHLIETLNTAEVMERTGRA